MTIQQSDIAINYANQVMNLVQQIANVRTATATLIGINAVVPLGNFWNALNTTALNADGSLGTADNSPVNGHYIDSRIYTNINRTVKNTDLSNALQVLSEFNTFCSGADTSSDGARPAFIDNVSL